MAGRSSSACERATGCCGRLPARSSDSPASGLSIPASTSSMHARSIDARSCRVLNDTEANRRGRRSLLGPLALLVVILLCTVFFVVRYRTDNSDRITVLKAADYQSLAISPANPGVLYFGYNDGVMRSIDGGQSWRVLVNRPNFNA